MTMVRVAGEYYGSIYTSGLKDYLAASAIAVCVLPLDAIVLSAEPATPPAKATQSLPAIRVDAPLERPRRIAPQPIRRAAIGPAVVKRRQAAKTPPPASAPPVSRPQPTALQVWQTTGNPRPTQTIGNLPPEYAGGQVAVGGRLGIFGNTSVFNTPYSVVNYTSKQIENQQAFTTSQVVTDDPSVILNSSPYSYGETLNIRGLYLFGNDAAFDGLFGVVSTDRQPIYGIERIEVFKGASAILQGVSPANSVAGYLNYIPKRATDAPIFTYTQSYISRGLFQEHLDVGRRFGANKEFGIRFNGAFLNGNTPFNNNSKDLGAATIGFDYRGDRFRATVDLGYYDSTNRGELPFYVVGGNVTRIPNAPIAQTNTAENWQRYHSRQPYGSTRLEYDLFPNTTATFAFGFGRNGSDSTVAVQSVDSNRGLVSRDAVYDNKFRENTNVYEGGIRSSIQTGPVSHKASIFATEQKAYATYGEVDYAPIASTNLYNPIYAPPPSPRLPVTSTPNRINEFTGFAIGDTIGLFSDRVLVTLGGRLQRVATNNIGSNTYDERALTPTYAILWKVLKNVSLYANYIEGLQLGPTAPTGTTNANQTFAPFVAKQKEAGVKIDFGRLGATFAAFEIGVPSAFTNAANTFVVDGLQVNRGLEFNTFGVVFTGARLLGGVTLLDARLKNTQDGAFDGNRAPGTPAVRVSLGAEYDIPFITGLTLTGRGIYTEKAFFDEANTLFIPSWTRFDAGFRYAFTGFERPMVFRFNVENIANSNYWESAQRGYLYQGAPRTFYASMQVKF